MATHSSVLAGGFHDQRSLQATVRGVAESDTTERPTLPLSILVIQPPSKSTWWCGQNPRNLVLMSLFITCCGFLKILTRK